MKILKQKMPHKQNMNHGSKVGELEEKFLNYQTKIIAMLT